MKIIKLKDQLLDEDVARLGGKMVDDSMYDTVIKESADVYTPEGNVLLKFRKGVIPVYMCEETFPIWELAATPTNNRGMAAGEVEIDGDGKVKGMKGVKAIAGDPGATRVKLRKNDGTIANKTVAKVVNSGIVGYMDGNPRFPYCRLTAFNIEHMEKFQACMPLIKHIDVEFRTLMPERHAAQMAYHSRTSKDFKLPGTSFTTITVNKNFRTAIHQDKGDLKEGFGVLCAFRKGSFRGGYLCFPKYRIAVDMDTTDILVCDVHQWHGNSEIRGIPGTWKRISLVLYYREQLALCSTAEEERKKAIHKTETHYMKDLQKELL
jgi:hypothetical protein